MLVGRSQTYWLQQSLYELQPWWSEGMQTEHEDAVVSHTPLQQSGGEEQKVVRLLQQVPKLQELLVQQSEGELQ